MVKAFIIMFSILVIPNCKKEVNNRITKFKDCDSFKPYKCFELKDESHFCNKYLQPFDPDNFIPSVEGLWLDTGSSKSFYHFVKKDGYIDDYRIYRQNTPEKEEDKFYRHNDPEEKEDLTEEFIFKHGEKYLNSYQIKFIRSNLYIIPMFPQGTHKILKVNEVICLVQGFSTKSSYGEILITFDNKEVDALSLIKVLNHLEETSIVYVKFKEKD